MEFDDRRAERRGRFDLRAAPAAMNSETRMPASPELARSTARSVSRCPAASSPPSVVRSSRRSGTMQAACGLMPERDVEHLAGRRHLEIERLVDVGLQPRNVVVADMAAVLAQMGGDAVGAGGDRELGRAHGSGWRAAARVPQGGDVIDIDAEAQHRGSHDVMPEFTRSILSALATTAWRATAR